MKDSTARLVPITFKVTEVDKKQMDVICTERRHKTISETYREAVRLYIDEYHRGKAA
jgi:hypothetical protein